MEKMVQKIQHPQQMRENNFMKNKTLSEI